MYRLFRYKSLVVCNKVLDICQGSCYETSKFVTNYENQYGNISVPLAARQQLFAYLYNQQFKTQNTFIEINDMAGACLQLPRELDTSFRNYDMTDSNVLKALKTTYYLLHNGNMPDDCENDFASWVNYMMHTEFSYPRLMVAYEAVLGPGSGFVCHIPEVERSMSLTPQINIHFAPQPPEPLLCGLNTPIFVGTPIGPDPPCNDKDVHLDVAREKYELYVQSLKDVFDVAYYNKCMGAASIEDFTVQFERSEYHYTLYYYDQAGNLAMTVPPAGVDESFFGVHVKLKDVKARRNNSVKYGIGDGTVMYQGTNYNTGWLAPEHQMQTMYTYNTLGQVVGQITPDAGYSQFWYDRLGRLAVSQNAKQAAFVDPANPSREKFSYTLYDPLGRITEVGEVGRDKALQNGTGSTTMTVTVSRDPVELNNWLMLEQSVNQSTPFVYSGSEATQVTHTTYDQSYFGGNGTLCPDELCQQNLRNRVSYTAVYDMINLPGQVTPADHRAATYYSYDIHGNVNTLVQDYNSGAMKASKNRYKKMDYDYDLISGKVNQVSYQAGMADQFYHRYSYDAENRLIKVGTSADNVIWEQDAAYDYYKHGPLARTVLGQQQVQGIDYAYTLQGWLKGVNSTALANTNPGGDFTNFDMGDDGRTGSSNGLVARDAYGYSLNYYTGDYKPIGAGVTPFATVMHNLTNTDNNTVANGLYNGNIASMFVNIPKLSDPQLYGYKYDQLNRLVSMDVFKGFNNSLNQWTGAPVAATEFKEVLTYDANGNIQTYLRNGDASQNGLNNFEYNYGSTNRLLNISNRDPQHHLPNPVNTKYNYSYDQIGNVTKDEKQGVQSAQWNVYGKLQNISGVNGDVSYSYDASGNRISKIDNSKEEWYVRDATGNLMATYQKENGHPLKLVELPMYGSEMLGILKPDIDMESATPLPDINQFMRGRKEYYLKNHLANTLAIISDIKLPVAINHVISFYNPVLISATAYSSYGAISQSFNGNNIKFAFNGQRRSQEISPTHQTAQFWEYDGDVGRRWNVDPEEKKFPWQSSYSTFDNNPVLKLDPLGLSANSTNVKKLKQGEYEVVGGGKPDNDKNIYLVDDKNKNILDGHGSKVVIGQSLTPYSFFTDNNKPVEGAIINLNSSSAIDFIKGTIMPLSFSLKTYMSRGTHGGNGEYNWDYKTIGVPDTKDLQVIRKYYYRGEKVNGIPGTTNKSMIIIASARDIGDYAAGYVAGKAGTGWLLARLALDGYESWGAKKFKAEGNTTKAAEKFGYDAAVPKTESGMRFPE